MSDSSAFKVMVLRLLALILRHLLMPYEIEGARKRAVYAIGDAEKLADKIEEENKQQVG